VGFTVDGISLGFSTTLVIRDHGLSALGDTSLFGEFANSKFGRRLT